MYIFFIYLFIAIGVLAGAGCASVYQAFATANNNNLYIGASLILFLATYLFSSINDTNLSIAYFIDNTFESFNNMKII